uniref:Uncharacterized protein n=1 Tax=Mycena chlorophos TaxID=658473 RepID=A0ABQ0KU92_MYCCL|nr:predicted protein [Mycena chlorophos]
MEHAAFKMLELESATHRTVHATGFPLVGCPHRPRTLHVGKFAQHSGRTTVTFNDALEALDEMGFSLDDLIVYTRGTGAVRAVFGAQQLAGGRRVEELHEFRVHVGRRTREDSFLLKYADHDGDKEEQEVVEDDED